MSLQEKIPWTFGEGTIYLTNFSSTDTVVFSTDRIPEGFLGVVEDINLIFTTSGGGIYLRKSLRGGRKIRFTDNITTTATGLSAIVSGGDFIEVLNGSTGVGVIDITLHGYIQPLPAGNILISRKRISSSIADGL